jgi:ribosome-interacting GTPase 1
MVSAKYLKELDFPFVPISAEKNQGIEELKEAIFKKLQLIRVYTKPRMDAADLKEPMMMRTNSTIEDACNRLHRDLARDFKYALVWGKSAKFPGQKVGLNHVLVEGDIFTIVKKQGS